METEIHLEKIKFYFCESALHVGYETQTDFINQ